MPNVLKSIKGYNVIQQFQKGTVQKELKTHPYKDCTNVDSRSNLNSQTWKYQIPG